MFASARELERVKEDLEALKDDTSILAERFSMYTEKFDSNAIVQDKKMDEIITLIKESHIRIDTTSDKIHSDLVGRVSREYYPTATIDRKFLDAKNCCGEEFVNKEAADLKHCELRKDITSIADLARRQAVNIRREATIVIMIITAIGTAYMNFFK